jgi:SAM-dependent methyltransferase
MTQALVIFDRSLQRRRRRRAASAEAATFLLDRVAAELADRLGTVLRRFDVAVDLGTPGEAVRAALHRLDSIGMVVSTDVLPRGKPFVVTDEEALPFADGALDLVVSALALQYVNDLPGALLQIRRALKPDGLFLAALLGGETLTELRQSFAAAESEIEGGASPRVAPFADLRDLGGLLQRAGFALPVTDVDRLTVRYDSVFALLRDLRRMGATNSLGGNLRAAVCSSRRTHPRDVRHRVAIGLGATSGSAATAQTRFGKGPARRRPRRTRNFCGRKSGPLAVSCSGRSLFHRRCDAREQALDRAAKVHDRRSDGNSHARSEDCIFDSRRAPFIAHQAQGQIGDRGALQFRHRVRPFAFELDQCCQVGNQRFIGRRHGIIAQIVHPHPFEFLSLLGLNEPIPTPTDVKWH